MACITSLSCWLLANRLKTLIASVTSWLLGSPQCLSRQAHSCRPCLTSPHEHCSQSARRSAPTCNDSRFGKELKFSNVGRLRHLVGFTTPCGEPGHRPSFCALGRHAYWLLQPRGHLQSCDSQFSGNSSLPLTLVWPSNWGWVSPLPDKYPLPHSVSRESPMKACRSPAYDRHT